MNRNYEKGRRKEYKFVKLMRDKGFIAQRTAGSHSPIDVIAVNPETKQIILIQCKPESMSSKEINKIEKLNENLNGMFNVEFIVL